MTAMENNVQQETHAAMLKTAKEQRTVRRNCVKPPICWNDRSPGLPLGTANRNFPVTLTKYLPLISVCGTFGTHCIQLKCYVKMAQFRKTGSHSVWTKCCLRKERRLPLHIRKHSGYSTEVSVRGLFEKFRGFLPIGYNRPRDLLPVFHMKLKLCMKYAMKFWCYMRQN
jgi:hypothetical protein